MGLIPPYTPLADTALSLTVWLGVVNLNASVSAAGSPPVLTLTLGSASPAVQPGYWVSLTQNDVGDIVQVFNLAGSPQIETVFWTTIAAVLGPNQAVLSSGQVVDAPSQAVIYRPLTEVIDNSGNYILQDSITFESSITTRPTLDFTVFSADRSIIPYGNSLITNIQNMVGMPVLMTDSMLDGSIASYLLGGGGGYNPGDIVAILQPGSTSPAYIQVDTTGAGGSIATSHIILGPSGTPGGYMYTPASGLATLAVTGHGTAATCQINTVTGPAFGAQPGDVFGGSIEQAKVTNYPGTQAIKIECQCVSWDAILNRRVLGITSAFPVSTTTLAFNGGEVIDQTNFIYGNLRYFNIGNAGNIFAIVSVTFNGVAQTFGSFKDYPPPVPAIGHPGTGGFQWYQDLGSGENLLYAGPFLPPFTDADSLDVVVQLVNPQTPTVSYETQTVDVIVEELLAFIQASEGITLANIVHAITESPFVSVPLVNVITFQANQTIDEALSSLMTYVNDGTINFWYYLDPRKGFHFEILGLTAAAPWDLLASDGSDANAQMEISCLATREKYANAAWINSENLLPAITEYFIGNSSIQNFQTGYPVGSQPTILFCAGLGSSGFPVLTPNPPPPYSFGVPPVTYPKAQTVGVEGESGFDWYWSPGSDQITEDGGHPPISSTEVLYVTFSPQIGQIQPYPPLTDIPDGAMIARQAVEGGSGEYDLTIDLSSQLPFVQGAAAQSAAQNIQQLLTEYFSNMAQQADFDTYRPGLAPGQSIGISL